MGYLTDFRQGSRSQLHTAKAIKLLQEIGGHMTVIIIVVLAFIGIIIPQVSWGKHCAVRI